MRRSRRRKKSRKLRRRRRRRRRRTRRKRGGGPVCCVQKRKDGQVLIEKEKLARFQKKIKECIAWKQNAQRKLQKVAQRQGDGPKLTRKAVAKFNARKREKLNRTQKKKRSLLGRMGNYFRRNPKKKT